MTKQEFLSHIRALYVVGNLSDSDSDSREAWTSPAMSGAACCKALDGMLRAMTDCGAITSDEAQSFYDNM